MGGRREWETWEARERHEAALLLLALLLLALLLLTLLLLTQLLLLY